MLAFENASNGHLQSWLPCVKCCHEEHFLLIIASSTLLPLLHPILTLDLVHLSHRLPSRYRRRHSPTSCFGYLLCSQPSSYINSLKMMNRLETLSEVAAEFQK